ncbi:MAG: hypothetical protein ACPGJE_09305 [Wenzhouxiangellaceae bacterium]
MKRFQKSAATAANNSSVGRSKPVSRGIVIVLSAALWLAPAVGIAESIEGFVRLATAADGSPSSLDVAVAGFKNTEGARVDLIGAVHVGDASYFDALERRFPNYDKVLFELVGEPEALTAPPEARAGGGGGALSLIGLMQGGMKDALGLSYQLEEIDYSATNFVHADLTAQEFQDSMRSRNESFVGMLFRAWVLGMAGQSGVRPGEAEADLLKILFADDRQLALKRMLAKQLAEQTDVLEMLSGEDGSTLIEVRNQRALDVLREQLEAGYKRIGIFYGAGHLPDLAERLEADFGMSSVGVEWVPAWNLRSAK